jgi:hypothetical protein
VQRSVDLLAAIFQDEEAGFKPLESRDVGKHVEVGDDAPEQGIQLFQRFLVLKVVVDLLVEQVVEREIHTDVDLVLERLDAIPKRVMEEGVPRSITAG